MLIYMVNRIEMNKNVVSFSSYDLHIMLYALERKEGKLGESLHIRHSFRTTIQQIVIEHNECGFVFLVMISLKNFHSQFQSTS
jgi:hypothetical protein